MKETLSQAFPEANFGAFETRRIGADYGLASQIFRCRFDGGGGTRSVVVKLWHTDTPAGTNEVFFYQTFGPNAGPRVPVCYHSAVDLHRQCGALVLEDFPSAVQGDCLQEITLEQSKALAQSLATLHGKWQGHDLLVQAEWLRYVVWTRHVNWFTSRRELFLQRFGDRLKGVAQSLLLRIEHSAALINERLEHVPMTLLHADLHLDNVIFERDTQPVILDWARCGRGPAALELAQLLFFMCRPGDFDEVLDSYVSAFHEWHPNELSPPAIRAQLGGALLARFATATCGVAHWQPASPREQALIDSDIQRASRAVEFWFKQDPGLFSFL